jgi:hypothetical protein
MDTHFSLSTAFCCHLLTFICHRPFSTSPSRLNLGLPLVLLPSGSLSNIFPTVLHWSIHTTCPVHSNLFSLISATISWFSYSSLSSWLVIILHIPCSTTRLWAISMFHYFLNLLFVLSSSSLPLPLLLLPLSLGDGRGGSGGVVSLSSSQLL